MRKNVLEGKSVFVKVRFENERRYRMCRVHRVYYIDRVVGMNKQRYIYASIEVHDPMEKSVHPLTCFINIPLSWFHYKAQGTLVQAAFAQEESDIHEVGHHAKHTTS